MAEKLKFNVIGTRLVNGMGPGRSFEVSESNVGPGYVGGDKEKGVPALNVAGLLLSNHVEPANAYTREWCGKLGAGFEEWAPQKETENSTNA